jgi:transposase
MGLLYVSTRQHVRFWRNRMLDEAPALQKLVEAGVYLPKYSPDLNPIELALSKLKAHLRKASRAYHSASLASDRSRRYGFQRAGMQELFRHAGCVRT